MIIKEKTIFITEDGQQFDDKAKAYEYIEELEYKEKKERERANNLYTLLSKQHYEDCQLGLSWSNESDVDVIYIDSEETQQTIADYIQAEYKGNGNGYDLQNGVYIGKTIALHFGGCGDWVDLYDLEEHRKKLLSTLHEAITTAKRVKNGL